MPFALADCNNFFVSCERAFQPDLEGKPVVVLSNNDGCVVARSNESKAMGIAMGTPFFKIKHLVENGSLHVRSSNYSLYGDLSSRVMSILASAFPEIEVYSIDEAFLRADGMNMDTLPSLCSSLVRHIRKCVGIPVSIGIADTRTLAKAASHFAKKYKGYKGVCRIGNEVQRLKALSLTPIDDVWGIGRRMAPKLSQMGIRTAAEFAARPENFVRRLMGITGVRTWKELNGISCISADKNDIRQSICTSRSFANTISDLKELTARVSDFAAICAKKLRDDGSVAEKVTTFLYTNRFREDLPQDFPDTTIRLQVPANNTQEIVAAALHALRLAWKPGFEYKKAGVIVHGIVRADEVQGSLFDFDDELRQRQNKLSDIMDKVNSSGKSLLRVATQREGHYADGIRKEHCSKPYSTRWDSLIEVH